MNKKKTILICYASLYYDYNGLNESTNLFYLAGSLEKAGYEVFVYHGSYALLEDKIKDIRPDAIGFSCDAENEHLLTKAIPSVRKFYETKGLKDLPVVVGGPQAPGLGQSFIEKSTCNYILRGEGEQTLVKLMDCVLSGKGSLSQIEGLVWTYGRLCYENSGIGLIQDLNTLPRPAYHTSLHKNRTYGRVIYTGRGCPFSCTFCASSVSHVKMRLREMTDVLDEIKENLVLNSSLKVFVIQDDTFCINADRVREFCSGMRDIRKQYDVIWFCETHVKTLLNNPSLLKEMIDSGLCRLQIGMESGDEEVLKKYNKDIKPSEVLELVSMACKLGLNQIAGNFIVGGPKEKPGVTEQFIRQIIREGAGVVDVNTGFLRNYPGTKIANNLSDYNLKAVMGQMTAGDDFPSVIPFDMTVDQVIEQRQILNRAIREEMGALLENHKIKDEIILKQIMLHNYGIDSRWYLELSSRPRILQYYLTMYEKEAVSFSPKMKLNETYVQRTFEFYRTVIIHDGVPYLEGNCITPLEAELLFYASGKFTIKEILEILWPKYSAAYESKQEFANFITDFYAKSDFKYFVSLFCYPI